MSAPRVLLVGLLTAALLTLAPPAARAEFDVGKATVKLARGAINLASGWVEIPKRIQQTGEQSGAVAGLTWGVLRGLGYGFVRTAAGAYEIVTFLFPAPPGYASVIQPEYVFSVEYDDSGRGPRSRSR